MIPDPAVRERGGLFFCLIPSPSSVNPVPQLVCKSPQLKYHCLGRLSRRNPQTGVHSFQFRYLVKGHGVQRSRGRSLRHPQQSLYYNNNNSHRWRCAPAELDPGTPCDPVLGGRRVPVSTQRCGGHEISCSLWAVEMSKSRFWKEDSDSNSPVTD